MKNKGKFLIIGISGALFALLIVLLRCVDGEAIGAAGTSVGLSHLNRFVFELTGVNMVWYNITDWLGLTAIIAAFLFAATGLVQVIKRRSILKVDKEILALGGLLPGCSNPEASFPSSHTMLVCVIMGSAIIIIGKYIKKKIAVHGNSGNLHRCNCSYGCRKAYFRSTLVYGYFRRIAYQYIFIGTVFCINY